MIYAKINGKSWPLAFTLAAMDGIEEATGKGIGELTLKISSKSERAEILNVLAVLMREGAADGAETPDVDELHRVMRPGDLMQALRSVSDAISEGMAMETDEPDDDTEVDVVLEEIKKKETQDG